MAVGFQADPGKRYNILRLIEASAVDVAAPTTGAHGEALSVNPQEMAIERCVVTIYPAAGTGALALTYAKIFGYNLFLARWFPLSSGSVDADRGKLNGGLAMGVIAADTFRFCEEVYDLSIWDRVAVEINGTAGTNDTWNVDIIIPKRLARVSVP